MLVVSIYQLDNVNRFIKGTAHLAASGNSSHVLVSHERVI